MNYLFLLTSAEEINEDNDFELDSVSDDEQDEADLGICAFFCTVQVVSFNCCCLFYLRLGLDSAHGVKAAVAAAHASANSQGKQGRDDATAPDHTFRETISEVSTLEHMHLQSRISVVWKI